MIVSIHPKDIHKVNMLLMTQFNILPQETIRKMDNGDKSHKKFKSSLGTCYHFNLTKLNEYSHIKHTNIPIKPCEFICSIYKQKGVFILCNFTLIGHRLIL